MTTVLCIDPGPEQSGYVETDGYFVYERGTVPNDELIASMPVADEMAIEMVASYGMAVGKDVFDTCVWIGRFIEAWSGPCTRVYRKDVKMALCGSMKAKDANIRQALIDRFGPGKDEAIGTKKAPGPLYGVRGHEWAALAVGVTYLDMQTEAA